MGKEKQKAPILSKDIERIPIVWRKIETLNKYPDNPRTLDKKGFEQLKNSFVDNPDFINARPLLLSDRTGQLVIIGGNSRYEVAKSLKYTELPCILFSGLTEEKEREYLVRDNVNNGNWDMDELFNKWDIEKLMDFGLDVKVKEPKPRDPLKKLTLRFTVEEFEEVSQTLCDLSDTMGCGSIEEALIKILREINSK